MATVNLEQEAKRIAEVMAVQGFYPWMAGEVVKKEASPMYWEELIPMVEEILKEIPR